LRQIASARTSAWAPCSNYAADKRDLVFLIFNEQLDALTGAALAAPRADDALVDQLLDYSSLSITAASARTGPVAQSCCRSSPSIGGQAGGDIPSDPATADQRQ